MRFHEEVGRGRRTSAGDQARATKHKTQIVTHLGDWAGLVEQRRRRGVEEKPPQRLDDQRIDTADTTSTWLDATTGVSLVLPRQLGHELVADHSHSLVPKLGCCAAVP